MTKTLASRITETLAFDRHIFFTFLLRFWGVCAGFGTVLFIPLTLGGVEQGFYFSFMSVIAAQVFFELGFNQVLTQIVAHEVGRENGESIKRFDFLYTPRLNDLRARVFFWYKWIASIFFIAIALVGYLFFSKNSLLSLNTWGGPWIALCTFSATNLYLSPRLAMVEGMGAVATIAKLRLRAAVVGTGLLWSVLAAGGGLWSAAMLPAVNFAFAVIWLYKHDRCEVGHEKNLTVPIKWRQDIFPFQWRIALSWISGYFIFQLFVPVAFATDGPVVAGQLGMALTIFNAISTIGLSWVTAKAPELGRLIGMSEAGVSYSLFLTVATRAIIAVGAAAGGFLLLVYMAEIFGVKLVQRVAPFSILIPLALTIIVNSTVFVMAAYMRAHKKEPMVWVSLAVAFLMTISVLVFRKAGASYLVWSYFFISLFVGLPWTVSIFKKFVPKSLSK